MKILNLHVATKYITRFSDYCFYDKDTNDWYNKDGFNELGYDKYGFNSMGMDERGFNKKGVHQNSGTYYDPIGYDKRGFNKKGIHRKTETNYDPIGYDVNGFNKRGFNKKGVHYKSITYYDPMGYDVNGYDKRGFDKNGINITTGTQVDIHGNDVNGNQIINEFIQIINQKILPICEMKFDGFYHMTHFENAASILKTGKLFSRSKNAMLQDMSKALLLTNSVIGKTDEGIQDHVRLYFRYKTPTFWYFEKIEGVVLLKFSKKLLSIPNAKISVGSAGKAYYETLYVNSKNLELIDFSTVFLSSKPYRSEVEKKYKTFRVVDSS